MIDSLEIEEWTIDGTKYGSDNNNLKIFILKNSKKINQNRKAVIYLHGGACIMLNAEQCLPVAARIAYDADATVFAVDFRNAPEAKAP